MSAKVKKQLLICALILTVCFLICFITYDPLNAVAVDDIFFKDDTLRVTVCGGKILAIELHRLDDEYVYPLEVQHVAAGTVVWIITKYRADDVEVLEGEMKQDQEIVAVRNDRRKCVYSLDKSLIATLKAAPKDIASKASSRFYGALRKTRYWGAVLIIGYLVLNEAGVFTPPKEP